MTVCHQRPWRSTVGGIAVVVGALGLLAHVAAVQGFRPAAWAAAAITLQAVVEPALETLGTRGASGADPAAGSGDGSGFPSGHAATASAVGRFSSP